MVLLKAQFHRNGESHKHMTGSDGKEKAQYFITQEVPPKCNYMYPQYWNIPPGFLAGETSSQQSVPRSTWRYQDICVHIYRWCVRALNARQYATLPRLMPTERHVVMYDVWVFPAHPSLCAALPDLTATVLSSLVTAALPNGRYQCCQLSCLGCLCRWKTVSFIGEGLVCTCYQPQRVQDG